MKEISRLTFMSLLSTQVFVRQILSKWILLMAQREAALFLTSIYSNINEPIKIISSHRTVMNNVVLLIYPTLWCFILAVILHGVWEDGPGKRRYGKWARRGGLEGNDIRWEHPKWFISRLKGGFRTGLKHQVALLIVVNYITVCGTWETHKWHTLKTSFLAE